MPTLLEDRTEPSNLHAGVTARRGVIRLICAIAAVLLAPIASANVRLTPIEPPVVVRATLNTSLIAYDLCWSPSSDRARQEIAQRVLDRATEPGRLYAIELPQLPLAWEAVRNNTLRDAYGRPIDRGQLRDARIHYERDVEAALMDVIARIRDKQSDIRIGLAGQSVPRELGSSGGAYQQLARSVDFLLLDISHEDRELQPRLAGWIDAVIRAADASRNASARDARFVREFESWLEGRGLADSGWIVLSSSGSWLLASAGPLPDGLFDSGTGEQDTIADVESSSPERTGKPGSGVSDERGARQQTGARVIRVQRDESERTERPRDDAPIHTGETGVDSFTGAPQPPAPLPGGGGGGGFHVPLDPDGVGPMNGGPGTIGTTPGPPEQPRKRDLIPGLGFSGATVAPHRVGNHFDPGYDAQAIARWDVVPYQDVTDRFEVGVVAFHMSGIERVSFSVEGGPFKDVAEPALNPQTGVVEYFATLHPDLFESSQEGLIEVRAVAYPKAGQPRVLEPLYLNLDKGGLPRHYAWVDPISGDDATGQVYTVPERPQSVLAFKTAQGAAHAIAWQPGQNYAADGGTVYLMPGNHVWGGYTWATRAPTRSRFLTIAAEPSAAAGSVRFTSGYMAFKTQLLHVVGVTFDGASAVSGPTADHGAPRIWLDRVVMRGSGRNDPRTLIDAGARAVYVTDSEITSTMNAIFGAQEGFARGVRIHSIGGDAFQNVPMVINCEVSDLDGSGNDTHTDLYQLNGTNMDNLIVYGLQAHDGIGGQVFISRRQPGQNDGIMRNIALVNVVIGSDGYGGQWLQNADHLILQNVVDLSHNFAIADDPLAVRGEVPSWTSTLKRVRISECVFRQFRAVNTGNDLASDPTNVISNNHFISGDPYGEVWTFGPLPSGSAAPNNPGVTVSSLSPVELELDGF